MPCYAVNRWSAVFFISYLSIVLYFLMNLVIQFDFFLLIWMDDWDSPVFGFGDSNSIIERTMLQQTKLKDFCSLSSFLFRCWLRSMRPFRRWRRKSSSSFYSTAAKLHSTLSVFYLVAPAGMGLHSAISEAWCVTSTPQNVNALSISLRDSYRLKLHPFCSLKQNRMRYANYATETESIDVSVYFWLVSRDIIHNDVSYSYIMFVYD